MPRPPARVGSRSTDRRRLRDMPQPEQRRPSPGASDIPADLSVRRTCTATATAARPPPRRRRRPVPPAAAAAAACQAVSDGPWKRAGLPQQYSDDVRVFYDDLSEYSYLDDDSFIDRESGFCALWYRPAYTRLNIAWLQAGRQPSTGAVPTAFVDSPSMPTRGLPHGGLTSPSPGSRTTRNACWSRGPRISRAQPKPDRGDGDRPAKDTDRCFSSSGCRGRTDRRSG